ncbi:unnamed protein product [Dovyalis caffra]|uniref:Uncharacterized protein n=1 Tax=Dovyalis caffra TaxID=77055 RepID=A0AAV1QR33_9ROSI|nr:unnamed protein product [Dovyalis caffra]
MRPIFNIARYGEKLKELTQMNTFNAFSAGSAYRYKTEQKYKTVEMTAFTG